MADATGAPFFSVVIPSYNRANVIGRAIRSVLVQGRCDYEIVVADDGSTDNTRDVVAGFDNGSVSYLRHDMNRGVCPTRNLGVGGSRGEWIVFLDSDDELMPDALSKLYRYIKEAPAGVDRVAGMYRWDDGQCSPDPKPTWQVLNYEGYIRWTAAVRRSDFHNCIRRSTFEQVGLPENRAYEALYHLEFSRLFRTWLVPEVIALEHQDTNDRWAMLGPFGRAAALLRDAPDGLWASELVVQKHGQAIQTFAPDRWRCYEGALVLQAFLAGRRWLGLKYAARCLRGRGLWGRCAVATLLGLMGRKWLALGQALRH
jgi:glycosyltransferase involved in cell wall biosynthesis